ncbi:MAG: deoxyhypusine synthase family protein [bacterium]|nr:deoxyhypusine synthase family protein [Myxococcales bacterium]MCB9542316.1 deoxyhypusine synthase family protein [Myxococcales bacterium]
MSHIDLTDPRWTTEALTGWLYQNGFTVGPAAEGGAARFVRYPGDARDGLPSEAVEVILTRAEGGHRLVFRGPDGEAVEVDARAFAETGPVTGFIDRHFRHYNAGIVARAARGYRAHIELGRKMMVTLAGAMSTAELGISLAEMIRQGKVHAITCTGANLEEDLFLLLHREDYRHVQWREQSAEADAELYDAGFNRVTDICIPEHTMHELIDRLKEIWAEAKASKREPQFPDVYLREAITSLMAKQPHLKARARDSWLWQAWQHDVPVFVPGWADSTVGNGFAAWCIKNEIAPHKLLLTDADAMVRLVHWLREEPNQWCGFFQIGGGIAGDFPICAVPLITQDLKEDTAPWGYFCQISDADTSYGGYSGAPPTEKITWGKITLDTPRYMISSDATIVAPLIFAYVMGL